jgi:membrane-bound serine protease (ClpP class)
MKGTFAMRCIWTVLVLAVLLVVPTAGAPAHAQAQAPSGVIYVAEVEGSITSVTIGYLRRAIHEAEAADANALIIQLNSGGGVLDQMRPFAGEIAKANVPIVVYVAPAGTASSAAGTLFLSAAHVSAMAPNTSFGSPYPIAQVDATLSAQTRDLVLNSVADQLREWNAARGRNTDWIDRAVREGLVLTNEQASATKPPAVDLVAADQEQLLTLLQGRVVKLDSGRSVQLATLGRSVDTIDPTLWERLRLLLADPTIAFILLVLGAMAIYLEFAAPGSSIFAGIGVVLLAGAALGLLVLPIRWWSLLLLLLAFGLIGADFFVPTHGGLTVTGIALLVVGALTLIDPAQAPGTVVAVWVVALVALALAAFAAFGIWLALRTRARPVTAGSEAMIGKLAEVRRRLDPDGMIFVEGALWQAISEDGPAEPGDWVRVVALHELHLVVQHLDREETAS